MDLTKKNCAPCEGGTPPLTSEQAQEFLRELPGWNLDKNKINKEFSFNDFKEAMLFVNKLAELAEQEQHHPDITIHYNKVIITLWTHAINGLSENDMILAAKINNLT
jgi:4a-hydroxytetrahydrobiopterin dehydratase